MARFLMFLPKPAILNKKHVLLLSVFLLGIQLVCLAQEPVTIEGSVFDSRTKEALPFATVALENSYIGVATNTEGEFKLVIPGHLSDGKIKISYVGYSEKSIAIDQASKASQIIFLDPLDVTIGEVVVKSRKISAREILRKSLSRIRANYYQDHYILDGFYREVSKEDRNETAIAEASVEVFKSGYNNRAGKEQVRVKRARRIIPENVQAKSKFNFEGGAYYRNSDDLIKNRISFLRSDHLPYYKYTIDRVLGSGTESVLVLYVSPNNSYINSMEANALGPAPILNSASLMYSGYIYIREADMAIIRVEYWLGEDRLRNAGSAYITQLPKDVSFTLNNVRFLAEYRKVKGKYNLSYTNGELNFRVRGGPFLVSTEYNVYNEFLILNMQVDSIRRFDPATISDSKDIIHDFDTIYDANYWMNYNIVMASARMKNIGRSSDVLLLRDKISREISEIWLKNFNERIHVHLDRNRYLSGDNIFFKAYVTEEATGLPSSRSNSFYALLRRNDGKVLDSARFVLKEGLGTGSFTLPDSLAVGLITFTAFSSDMQNYSAENAFVQTLSVRNRIAFMEEMKNKPDRVEADMTLADEVPAIVSFFPEGGELISGINNNMGLTVTDKGGSPLKSTLVIRDRDRNIIDTVSTNVYGIGEFSFRPEKSVNYYAHIINENTLLPETFDLPKAKREGLAMKLLDTKNDTLRVRIISNTKYVQKAYLVLSSGMDILGDKHFELSDSRVVEIPYKAGRRGVATLTLYDENIPVAERCVLLSSENRAFVSASTDFFAYPAKSNTNLSVSVSDKKGKPVQAYLSVAVVDSINAIEANYSLSNIFYSLWLKPGLREELPAGLAEYIGYRIEKAKSTDYKLINSFLLCYGWRKISPLSNFYAGSDNSDNVAADYDVITTELIPKKSKRIKRRKGGVSFLILDNYDAYNLNFDKESKSSFRVGPGEMTSPIMVGLDEPKDIKNWSLQCIKEINSDFFDKTKDFKQSPVSFKFDNKPVLEPLRFDKDVIIIDEVVVKGKFTEKPETNIGDRYRFSNATASYKGTPEEHPGAKSIISLLQEISSPRRIDHSPLVGEVYYREVIKNPMMPNAKILPVLFIVNDVPVTTNYHELHYIPVEQILSMRVVIGANAFSFFGERAQGGAVLIYTKRDFAPTYNSPLGDLGFITVDPLCKVSREFIKPVYDSININEGPRLRATIHWEPMITTDMNGNAEVMYFNPGYNSKVVGIIQGITKDGVPLQTRFRYRVIKE